MRRIAIIGLGRFGTTLARALSGLGAEVLALDRDLEKVSAVMPDVALAVCADATDEKALRDNGLDSVETAVVSMGESFEATQLCMVLLRKLGVPEILTKSSDPVRIKILTRIGADEVISPEREGAERLAQRLVTPNVVEHLHLAGGRALVQVKVPARMVGKSIGELDVRRRYRVNVVAIRRGSGTDQEMLNDLPSAADVIEEGDVLVVIGGEEEIRQLAE